MTVVKSVDALISEAERAEALLAARSDSLGFDASLSSTLHIHSFQLLLLMLLLVLLVLLVVVVVLLLLLMMMMLLLLLLVVVMPVALTPLLSFTTWSM